MSVLAYIDSQNSDFLELRKIEKSLFERLIGKLREADDPRVSIGQREAALDFCEKLWLTLIQDIMSKQNRLPAELKAKLASIGLWIVKECTRIRGDGGGSLEAIIEVNEIVMAGLE